MLLDELIDVSFSSIGKKNADFEKELGKADSYKIAFLRNITVEPLLPVLKFLCYNQSIKPDIFIGNYDAILQDALDLNNDFHKFHSDLVIISLDINVFSPKIANEINRLDEQDIEKEMDRVLDYLNTVITKIKAGKDVPVLVHNFLSRGYTAYGIYDSQRLNRYRNVIRELNLQLTQLVSVNFNSVYVVDVEHIQSIIGYLNFFDTRFWHIAKIPFTQLALKYIAYEYFKFIKNFKGKSKKCLVLDCDNTLWGGIIGEDGIQGIQLGKNYPGSAFFEFQEAILELYHKGVILALCSKNNEPDVIHVLKNHPDMLLKEKHIVVKKINWEDKATNLIKIAEELNIGLDSVVFVDDNEFECNLVKSALPEVTVLQLPKDASKYKDKLVSSGLFDTLCVSDEDKKRSELYHAEIKRKKHKSQSRDFKIEDYLKSLEMEVYIRSGDDFTIPRISQLTQRTNQFNLTTKRYSETEIKKLTGESSSKVIYLKVKDLYGDLGIVAAAILKFENKDVILDNFLMSCRSLGRNIETLFLKKCTDFANEKRYERVIGIYVPSEKNRQVANFYKQHGFLTSEEAKTISKFYFPLEKGMLHFPDYFKKIDCLFE